MFPFYLEMPVISQTTTDNKISQGKGAVLRPLHVAAAVMVEGQTYPSLGVHSLRLAIVVAVGYVRAFAHAHVLRRPCIQNPNVKVRFCTEKSDQYAFCFLRNQMS